MFVIMAVATDERVANGFAAIAVGLTVGFCALVGGPLTGASMNPARSLGPALAGGFWHGHWLYSVAPITAMLVAARAYDFLRQTRPPEGATAPATLGVEGQSVPKWDLDSVDLRARLNPGFEDHKIKNEDYDQS
jgi:hypothetical protein